MEFLPLSINERRVYAGFWKRFCAGFVDCLIMMVPVILFLWLGEFGRAIMFICVIPSTAMYFVYSIYFNAKYGGTLGKLAVDIRVTKPDGSRIGWSEAWKRSAVDIGFAAVMVCGQMWAIVCMDNWDAAKGFVERQQFIDAQLPAWYTTVNVLQQVWIWSEVVVLLFNVRKRALHDFIAGTVVIHKEFAEPDDLLAQPIVPEEPMVEQPSAK
jgi:uncharacterized RDD family membrane protein YckC